MYKRGKRIAPRRRTNRRRTNRRLAAVAAALLLCTAAAAAVQTPPADGDASTAPAAEDIRPVAALTPAEKIQPPAVEPPSMNPDSAPAAEDIRPVAALTPAEKIQPPAVEPPSMNPDSAPAAEDIRPAPVKEEVQPPAAEAAEPPAASDSADAWNLILVNPWTPLPGSFSVELTKLKNGQSVDARCYPDLQAMLDGCRAAGPSPVVCSAYRSQEKQEALFQNKVKRLLAQGYAEEAAKTEAGKSVAVPGTSEHQLGLAVDLVDLENQNLDQTQERTAAQKWLMENSWNYGFILRYPSDKSGVTGIVYEPWHYRYVGKDAAREMHEQGLCLEEYLARRDG